jgi:hypothetical protein
MMRAVHAGSGAPAMNAWMRVVALDPDVVARLLHGLVLQCIVERTLRSLGGPPPPELKVLQLAIWQDANA